MRKVAIYSVSALMIIILSFGEFMGTYPLGIGLLLALTALGLNAPVLSVFLVLSGLFNFSWLNFAYNMGAGVVSSAMWLLSLKFKPKGYYYVLSGIMAQLGFVIAAIVMKFDGIACGLSVFLCAIYAFISYSVGVPILKNGLRYKFLDSEFISGGIILASLAYGLSEMPFVFPLTPLFFAVCVLFSAKIVGAGSVCVGLCVALGYAIGGGTSLIGAFALMSLTSLMFIPAPRPLSALSLILSFVMYTLFFDVLPPNAWMWLVSLLIGGLIYVVAPTSFLRRTREFFTPDGRKTLRSMVNRSRVESGRRLEAVGEVFGEMSAVMSSGEGELSRSHLMELTQSLVTDVCAKCPRHAECVSGGVMPSVNEVMKSALSNGRVSVADMPDRIKTECISLAALISRSGELAERYSERLSRVKSTDAAKKMVAAQLGGISDIMFSLAKKQAEPLKFSAEIEKKLAEELTYRMVITTEALVSANNTRVMLTVLTETLDRDVIVKVLKKSLGTPFVIESVESGNESGYSVVFASAKPRFDVVFSACGRSKTPDAPSGDTHSFIKIDSHTFMMAVCDGMGSGEKANEFSTSTISLIENFYKAGFSHSLVLSSVNNFLSLSSEEIYSAVDIAVVDLETGMLDIIKIGSPTSYIKTKDSVFRVDGSALPIGVLEEMKPSVTTYALGGGETVVLTSDGAADSYDGDSLGDIINNGNCLPEPLCKEIVSEATKRTGEPIDDITAVAFHIFRSV